MTPSQRADAATTEIAGARHAALASERADLLAALRSIGPATNRELGIETAVSPSGYRSGLLRRLRSMGLATNDGERWRAL